MPTTPSHLGTAKAAKWLDMPERTVRDLCSKGKLEADRYFHNSKWLIPVEALKRIRPIPADPNLFAEFADIADLAELIPQSE